MSAYVGRVYPPQPPRLASSAQYDYLKRLLAGRELSESERETVQNARERAMEGRLTSREASALIDLLKASQPPSRPVSEIIRAGVYRDDTGELFRVYNGQKSGQMLVKRILPGGEYDYVGAARKHMKPSWTRLTVDEVGELGKAFDHCMMCGRRLDDPESVDRGIGPVCAGRYDA